MTSGWSIKQPGPAPSHHLLQLRSLFLGSVYPGGGWEVSGCLGQVSSYGGYGLCNGKYSML